MSTRTRTLQASSPLGEPFEVRVVGHDRLLKRFGDDFVDDAIGSSYVFVGQRGVGKRTTALWLARLLLCKSPSDGGLQPCDACVACQKVLHGTHPDVYEVTRQEGRTQVRMEQVEALLAAAEYEPLEGEKRVFLLSDAEALNESSMNSLLKWLEEPRRKQVFILCVPSARMLLPTILSRCRVVRFAPLPLDEVGRWLRGRSSDAGRADLAAALSEGRPGFGLRLLEDDKVWQVREKVVEQALMLGRADAGAALDVAEKLEGSLGSDKRADLDSLLTFLTAWYRDLLWLSKGLDASRLLNLDHRGELADIARRFPLERVLGSLTALDEAREHMSRNVNPKLLFARLALHLRPPDPQG